MEGEMETEMEDDARLRKGDERKLQAMVDDAKVMLREMEGKVEGLEEARRELDKRAAQALQQIHALFQKVAQHKHGLEEGVKAVRKDACQPITDAANACRVLARVLRNTEGSGGGAGGGMVGEEEQHVGFALVVGEATAKGGRGSGGDGGRRGGGRRRVVLVEFVVQDGGGGGDGTVHSALHRWKKAWRLYIDVDAEWKARPGVLSQPRRSLKTARSYHGAAVVTPSNHVFVVGGSGRDGFLNSVERLRGSNNNRAWEEQAGLAIPTARFRCGACAVGTTMIVVGGYNRNGQLGVVEAVDTVSGVHTTLPPLPQPVAGCTVVSVQGKVIVMGGFNGVYLNTVWALDVGNGPNLHPQQQQQQRWTSLPSMSQRRSFHGAAAGGGCVFVCGGSTSNRLDSCEMLRVAVRGGGDGEGQGEWEALPPMPNELSHFGCCYGGGNVFVAGGWPAERLVFALSVRERKWTQVAELATGRSACVAVCVGRRVMVLGGLDDSYLDSCELLEF